MRRNIVGFIVTFALGFLSAPLTASAQSPTKVHHIGWLASTEPDWRQAHSFLQGLSELGYIEGQNIVIEYRWAERRFERLPALAAELVRLKVEVIFALGGAAAGAARQATDTIPIVTTAGDPVAQGLVASLARPGGNVTGVSSLVPELNSKRLEILKDAVPKLARVGFLRSSLGVLQGDLQMREIRPAALALKVKLEEIETQLDAKGLQSAFQTAKQKQVNA